MKIKQDFEAARLSTLISCELPRNQQNITPVAPGVGTDSASIASNNNRAALCREIRMVQDLIERCLQLYMNKDEVVKTLLQQAKIHPDFTITIWDRLEQENAEFFKVYYTKLILQKQIAEFNELLVKHHHLLNYNPPLEAPLQGGIQHMPVNHLHKGYTLLQQQPILTTGHPQNGSMGTISNFNLVNENLELGNFNSHQMNYGRWMPMDNNTVEIAPIEPLIKSEIPSPVSVASHDPFPFFPELSESVDPSAFEFAGLSNVQNVSQVPPGPGNAGFNILTDIEDYSGSSGFFDTSEQNENVEDFFADIIAASGSQSEEES